MYSADELRKTFKIYERAVSRILHCLALFIALLQFRISSESLLFAILMHISQLST